MMELPQVLALNHLLTGQSWARECLRPYAGKRVLFRLSPLPDLGLLILDTGLVKTDALEVPADLTVNVKPGALPHLLARDQAAMAQVDLTGPVDLASAVQLLFRELAWDAEEDLSKIVGDVLAHRMVAAARGMLAWQKDAASRLAENLAEYLTEERPLLAQRADAATLLRSVEVLEQDCTRLERRLEQLEARTRRARA